MERKSYSETGTFAWRRVNHQRSTVQLYDTLTERQPDSVAFVW